ncbi:MAG: glycoside hydrolase family 15, partial [Planifilum fulgidum]
MGEKPYLIDAVVGNGRMLATLGRNGRLYRLWWPRIDFPQHVREMHAGIWLPGAAEKVLWLHEGNEWSHRQRYDGDLPILVTEAVHAGSGLKVSCEDFAVPGADVLVRRYRVTNGSDRT